MVKLRTSISTASVAATVLEDVIQTSKDRGLLVVEVPQTAVRVIFDFLEERPSDDAQRAMVQEARKLLGEMNTGSRMVGMGVLLAEKVSEFVHLAINIEDGRTGIRS